MEKQDDSLPGVTLKFETSEVIGVAADGKRSLKISFRAWAERAVWEKVEHRLQEGIRIYVEDDFKTQMLRVVREENQRLTLERHNLLCDKSRLMTEVADLKSSLNALIQREKQRG